MILAELARYKKGISINNRTAYPMSVHIRSSIAQAKRNPNHSITERQFERITDIRSILNLPLFDKEYIMKSKTRKWARQHYTQLIQIEKENAK